MYDSIPVRDFKDYWEEFVVRPPYQRKSVWSRKKKQALLDSLFRRYYVPRIVIREVRRDKEQTAREVIDGQQRITTAKEFLSDEIPLPKTLADIDSSLPGAHYSDLPADLRRFVDRELKLWPKEESIISEASSKLAAGNIKLDPVVKARRQTRDAVASLDQR